MAKRTNIFTPSDPIYKKAREKNLAALDQEIKNEKREKFKEKFKIVKKKK